MSSDPKIHVLYVDDEENNISSFKATFRREFTIYTAISGDEAQKILAETEIHVLISDEKMPNMRGVELLEQAYKDYPHQVRILITAYSDLETLKAAVNKGFIFKYLVKPWVEEELRDAITGAYALYQKNHPPKSELEAILDRRNDLQKQIKELEEQLQLKKQQITGSDRKSGI